MRTRARDLDASVTLTPAGLEVHAERPRFTLGPFSIAPLRNEVTVVLGDNGAGKSTFFEALRGHPQLAKLDIAHLPQTFSLPPHTRVEDGFAFVASRRIKGDNEQAQEVQRVLDLVRLSSKQKERFRALSGGMHRRAGIGLALLGRPDLVILDEPTAGLDMSQREELLAVIVDVSQRVPLLMSSHIQDDLEATASRIILLAEGQLIFDGERETFEAFASEDSRTVWASAYRNLLAASHSR